MTDAFAAFLDEPRWLAWREEERRGRRTKIPYAAAVGMRGPGSSTDPATWGTHAEAERRARELNDGRKTGCGIPLGDIGDNIYLAGADLDSSLDENGVLAGWAANIIAALGTYAETSPSGKGVKAFFYIPAEQVRSFLDCIGVDRDKWGTKRGIPGLSGADHGPGIELYCAGRYFTVTGRLWSANHPHIVLLDDGQLAQLAALVPPAKRAGGQDTSRSAKAFRAARDMKATSFEEMCEGLQRHPDVEIRAWYREKGTADGSRELRRIWDKITDPAAALYSDGVTLADFWAYMPQHNYIYAPTREPWPGASVDGRIGPVPLFNPDGTPKLDKKGEPVAIRASAWLDRHKPIEQMTWAPGQPMVIRDRLISNAGWIQRQRVSCFNLYRPSTLPHGEPAEAGRWIAHVDLVYPEEAEHIRRWLAHRVQRPQEKINHALVLGGKQGIGKDSLIEPVKRAVGPWNVEEISPAQLMGRFNGFARSVMLRISEARDLGELDRYTFYEHLKVYTAAPPDVLRVDEKNLREYNILNCCGVIITTNHKTDGLYLPADDRRHYVAWSQLTEEDFTQDYWTELWGWYDSGGDHHVAAYLAQLDLGVFDPKAPPPKTDAWWEIVNAGRASEDAELADAIDRLGNPDVVTAARVVGAAATEDFAAWLKDRKNRRNIPHRFEAVGYVPVRNPDRKTGLWKIGSQRIVVYGKSSLTRQQQLAAVRALNPVPDPDPGH